MARSQYRTIGRVVTVLSVTLAALSIPHSAHACSCRPDASVENQADYVAVAFVGHQIEQSKYNSEWDRIVFRVHRVYKGQLGPTVEVLTTTVSNCGTWFHPGRAAGVIAYDNSWGVEGTYGVGHCFGHATRYELEEVFGMGYPPDETLVPEHRSGHNPTVGILLTAGALALVAIGEIVIRRQRRRPDS